MQRRKPSECEKQFMYGNRKNYALTVFSLVISAATDVSLAFMLLYIFEAAGNRTEGSLAFAVGFGVGFCLLYLLFRFLKRKYMNRYLKTALSQFKDYIFCRILGKSISSFGNESSAKFISAFSNDLNSIEQNYLVGSLNIIGSMLSFIGSAIAMLIISWKLALPLITLAVIFLGLSLIYGNRLVSKEKMTSNENMSFIDQVKDLLNGFIVIKSFKAEKEVREIFRKQNSTLETVKQNRRVTSDTVSIISDISSLVLNLTLFVLGFFMIYVISDSSINAAVFMAFLQLTGYMLVPIRQLGIGISNRRAAQALIDRIADAVENEPEVNETRTETLDGIDDGITLEHLSFSYNDKKGALDDVSFHFEKGKSYAIVGGSGSGKSTMLKLILGYYDDYSGSVKVGGKEIKNVSLDSLYDWVSVIQQDVFLFDSSLKDNITMFRDFSEESLRDAINKAGLSGLVAEKGEDYSCGESGHNLSGGEKQRVSIARCLLRGTPVLLMDEATAALDAETAFSVTNEILNIDGLTRIIVTHGLEEALLRRYDEIIVIQGGKISETGHFDDLMAQKGYFYSLYNVFQS